MPTLLFTNICTQPAHSMNLTIFSFFLRFLLASRFIEWPRNAQKNGPALCWIGPKPSSYFEDEILRSMKSASPVRRRRATARFFKIQHILMLRHTANINYKTECYSTCRVGWLQHKFVHQKTLWKKCVQGSTAYMGIVKHCNCARIYPRMLRMYWC